LIYIFYLNKMCFYLKNENMSSETLTSFLEAAYILLAAPEVSPSESKAMANIIVKTALELDAVSRPNGSGNAPHAKAPTSHPSSKEEDGMDDALACFFKAVKNADSVREQEKNDPSRNLETASPPLTENGRTDHVERQDSQKTLLNESAGHSPIPQKLEEFFKAVREITSSPEAQKKDGRTDKKEEVPLEKPSYLQKNAAAAGVAVMSRLIREPLINAVRLHVTAGGGKNASYYLSEACASPKKAFAGLSVDLWVSAIRACARLSTEQAIMKDEKGKDSELHAAAIAITVATVTAMDIVSEQFIKKMAQTKLDNPGATVPETARRLFETGFKKGLQKLMRGSLAQTAGGALGAAAFLLSIEALTAQREKPLSPLEAIFIATLTGVLTAIISAPLKT
jgi:hypothetical protein